MEIANYKVGTSFEISCTKHYIENKNAFIYDSFGIKKEFAWLYGRKPEEIINVKATIIEEDVIVKDLIKDSSYDNNCIDYFGFIDGFENDDLDISIIWGNIKSYCVCFTYGPDSERFWNCDQLDDKNKDYLWRKGDRRAMTVRLKIEEI